MEYAGLVDTRAVWRCVDPDCEFTDSRQLTESELDELELPEEEPVPDFPGDWEAGRGLRPVTPDIECRSTIVVSLDPAPLRDGFPTKIATGTTHRW